MMMYQSEQSMEMPEQVAILGAAFDPIASHHKLLGLKAHERTGLPILMMPCWHHRFSKDASLADPEHRWNMLSLMCQGENCLVPFKWEIEHQHNGSMFQTMEALTTDYPATKFTLIIGTDNANVIEKDWDRGNLLIEKFPFVVFRRHLPNGKFVKETTRWFREQPHQFFDGPCEGSSTDVRDLIQNGPRLEAQKLVGPEVYNYIRNHKLYGWK